MGFVLDLVHTLGFSHWATALGRFLKVGARLMLGKSYIWVKAVWGPVEIREIWDVCAQSPFVVHQTPSHFFSVFFLAL